MPPRVVPRIKLWQRLRRLAFLEFLQLSVVMYYSVVASKDQMILALSLSFKADNSLLYNGQKERVERLGSR